MSTILNNNRVINQHDPILEKLHAENFGPNCAQSNFPASQSTHPLARPPSIPYQQTQGKEPHAFTTAASIRASTERNTSELPPPPTKFASRGINPFTSDSESFYIRQSLSDQPQANQLTGIRSFNELTNHLTTYAGWKNADTLEGGIRPSEVRPPAEGLVTRIFNSILGCFDPARDIASSTRPKKRSKPLLPPRKGSPLPSESPISNKHYLVHPGDRPIKELAARVRANVEANNIPDYRLPSIQISKNPSLPEIKPLHPKGKLKEGIFTYLFKGFVRGVSRFLGAIVRGFDPSWH